MNRNLVLIGLFLLLLVSAAFFVMSEGINPLGLTKKTADIHGTKVTLEIADDDKERTVGLSGRDSIAENRGMLFLFDQPGQYSFWMKDMKFPIDIIYLRGNKIVTVFYEVPAMVTSDAGDLPNQTIYAPTTPADRVLELKAGQAKKLDLKEGDEITFDL